MIARSRIRSFVGVALALAAVSGLARGDAALVGVSCVSYVLAPGVDQCTSSTPKITVRTEKGSGEDADYPNAARILVDVVGANDNGALNSVSVVTQQPLVAGGVSQIVRQGTTPTLVAAQGASPSLRQKDAIVIVDQASGVPGLSVDASAGVAGQNAGSVVIVADSLQNLSVNVNGYNGKVGEDPRLTLAKKALSFDPGVPGGIAAAYSSRRTADTLGTLPLSFDQGDLNNYQASGLSCRSDETAIGRSDSYGAGTLFDPGAPYGIDITADAQEQTKRSFCQRLPEFTATQQCQAETEYSFQAVCRVTPEGRSNRFLKRDKVLWQRNVCTQSFDAQVRRKIIRTAHIQINIPGQKSYSGEISHEISFSQSYNVLTANNGTNGALDNSVACLPIPGTMTAPKCSDVGASGGNYPSCTCPSGYSWSGSSCTSPTTQSQCGDFGASGTFPSCSCAAGYTFSVNSQLAWYNPFWQQGYTLPANATINLSLADDKVVNTWNTPGVYPEQDNSSVGSPQNGAKVTYLPRPAYDASGRVINNNSLLWFNDVNSVPVTTVSGDSGSYDVYGCAKVISTSGSSRYGDVNSLTTPKVASKYNLYTEYFLSFDAQTIGFSEADLINAKKLGGVIRTSNCFAYESVDQVVLGQVGKGTWALVTDNSDLGHPAPPGPNADSPLAPLIASVSKCVAPYTQPIGTETYIQYDQENSCYIDDPRTPPDWLRKFKANAMTQAAPDPLSPAVNFNAVTSGDFTVPEMYSNIWTKNSSVANGSSSDLGVISNTTNLNAEFTFPSSTLPAVALALTSQQQQDYCVPVPSAVADPNSSYAESVAESNVTLTRSIAVPHYSFSQGSSVAVPDGSSPKKVCLNGMRLDQFLANVPRPSCPIGTSTKLRMSKFSALAGDPVWQTWSELPATSLPTDQNYSIRSEFVETRYDDLPSEIFTAPSSEIHPAVSTDLSSSFTGQAFPPSYGFTRATPAGIAGVTVGLTATSPKDVFSVSSGGSTMRANKGWLRESSLKNKNGSFVTPTTFTPFDGPTLFDRSNAWCNAGAFVTAGSTLVKSFGAKGILRDVPKHVFGFTLTNVVGGLDKQYTGIEITGTDSTQGFYADPRIYQVQNGASVSNFSPDADNVLTSLSAEAFRSSNYPFLGSRFAEVCSPGQSYNQFTGFCHDPATPWRSGQRTVNRVLQDGVTKEPWAFALTKQKLLSPVAKLDIPFYPATGGLTPVGGTTSDPGNICFTNPTACTAGLATDPNSIDVDFDPLTKYFQLGFLRPLRDMVDDVAVSRSIFMNRPESLDQMVLGPGFASSRNGQNSPACTSGITIVAVPVPATPVLDPVSGQTYSVTLDRDNYLSGTTDAGQWWGPVVITLTPHCSQNVVYTYSSAIRQLGPNGQVLAPNTSPTQGLVGVDPSTQNLYLTFNNAANQPIWRMKNINESIAAGMSATTGFETLGIVEVAAPQIRNRASEWSSTSRVKGGKGYQSSILTTPTDSTQDPNIQPLTCSSDNTQGGRWGLVGVSGNVTTVLGQTSATVASTSGIQVGNLVSCSACGVPSGTSVSAVSGATGITLSQAATATGTYLASFSTTTPVTNGGGATDDCTSALVPCALTPEELSLFTKPVANSKALTVTRAAATQFTPWGFELPTSAPKSSAYKATQPFGQWTVMASGADAASVPDCSIYNGGSAASDVLLARAGIQGVSDVSASTTVVDELGAYKIKNPLTPLLDFIIVPDDSRPSASIRKSQSCLQWDSVTGTTCNSFYPTLGGPETAPLIFGGTWQTVFVDTRTRVSQECKAFATTVNGQLSAACSGGYMSAAATAAINNGVGACAVGSSVAPLCKPCAEDATKQCAPFMQPKAEAITTRCAPGSCQFPENDQSYQVESSIPVSGSKGEDGSNSGTATVFCRNCKNVNYSAIPGTGGLGSSPLSSDRSKTLTCVSWNNNPLAPLFSVRNLWSQPFVGGTAGANGQPGLVGGSLQIYQDMTPEAIFQISDTNFWNSQAQ